MRCPHCEAADTVERREWTEVGYRRFRCGTCRWEVSGQRAVLLTKPITNDAGVLGDPDSDRLRRLPLRLLSCRFLQRPNQAQHPPGAAILVSRYIGAWQRAGR